MAQALCELQTELQHPLPEESNIKDETGTILSFQTTNIKPFAPKTPSGKESKRKPRKCPPKLAKKFAENLAGEETEVEISTSVISECYDKTNHLSPTFTQEPEEAGDGFLEKCNPLVTSADDSDHRFSDVVENYCSSTTGNFPSFRELARLDDNFLAKRCGLGYGAGRAIKLAQGVVERRIQLRELECDSSITLSLSEYDNLAEKLRVIDGFGPFTCANVLMCMGYYHVHSKNTSFQTVQQDLEDIYGKSEIWHFYEERFGKLSEMPHSSYKLITAKYERKETREK